MQTAAFGKIVKFVLLNWSKLTASSSVPSTAGSRSASTKFHWPGEKKIELEVWSLRDMEDRE